jgi:hypothetical protein
VAACVGVVVAGFSRCASHLAARFVLFMLLW